MSTRKRACLGPLSAHAVTLNGQLPELSEDEFLLVKSPCLWHFVTASGAKALSVGDFSWSRLFQRRQSCLCLGERTLFLYAERSSFTSDGSHGWGTVDDSGLLTTFCSEKWDWDRSFQFCCHCLITTSCLTLLQHHRLGCLAPLSVEFSRQEY